MAKNNKVTVIHVFRNPNQTASIQVEEKQESNLTLLNISYKSSIFKYFFSGKSLAKGMKMAQKQNGNIHKIFLNVFYPLGAHLPWLSKLFSAPIYAIEHWTGYHQSIKTFNINHPHLKVAKWASKYCRKVIGVSQNLNEAMQANGLKNVKGVVYNAVNTSIFNHQSERKEGFKWLHISSLKDEHKNFKMLLKAYAATTQNQKAELVVINSGDETPFRDLINELGIKVQFCGAKTIEEVAEIMKSCNAFALSSNYENMPCVIAEALCCGLPVVSTQVGGIAEVLNLQNGILVPKQDTIAFAKAMEKLQKDYNLYDAFEISRDAIDKFGTKAVLKQLEKELEL